MSRRRCFSRLRPGKTILMVFPPKAPSLAIAMFRNTNFFKDFPVFLLFISICQSENIHPSEVTLASPSLCNSLSYHSSDLFNYSQIHLFHQASSPGFLYCWIFCTPDLQKNLEISIYLTVFKAFGIFALLVFPGGQKPPEKSNFRKINVKQFYSLQVGMFERGAGSQEPGERLK